MMQHPGYRYEHIDYLASSHAHFELSVKDSSFVTIHWHDALEMIRILEGELTAYIGQSEVKLVPGDTVLIPPNVLHSTISKTGNTAILLQMPAQDLYHYVPEMEQMELTWHVHDQDPLRREKMDRVNQLLDELLEIQKQNQPGSILLFESRLLEIIWHLYTNFTREISRADFQRSEKDLKRLMQVINYTENHYTEPISLQSIADELHLQVNYFCRFFKNNTGQTYLEYLSDYRLSKIYHDLKLTDLPIAELCERHGYTNSKLFRKYFQERFGDTPGNIRKASRF